MRESGHFNVLVLGGAGYIGLHTCKALEQGGFKPCVLDDFSSGHQDMLQWPYVKANIKSKASLEAAFDVWKPKAVIHLAGLIQVGESMQHPQKYYETNVGSIFELLHVMQNNGCNKLVFASSAAVYGDQKSFEYSNPTSPYGRAKKMAEIVLQDYSCASDLRAISLRYFNVAGADPECEFGEAHDPETHIIPLILRATEENPIKLFGADFDTPDGTAIRDYIHVSDVAEANVKALEFLFDSTKDSQYFSVDIGRGMGTSLLHLINTVERILDKKIPTIAYGARLGDPKELIAENNGHLINWHSRYQLYEIIRTANAWEEKNVQTKNVI